MEISAFNLPKSSCGLLREKKSGSEGSKIGIGEASELDDCLSIFIATPMIYDEDVTLIASEANKYIGMAAAFLDNAEYILKNAEESAPGYGFACEFFRLFFI